MPGSIYKYLLGVIFMAVLWGTDSFAYSYTGQVVDASTGKPIPGALVTIEDTLTATNSEGAFQISGTGYMLGVRAHGYSRRSIPLMGPKGAVRGIQKVQLAPFKPKALYLSFYGVGYGGLRQSALKLINDTELNALVIDIKGDKGMIPHKSSIQLASTVGALKITTVKDMKALVDDLHGRNIYAIARIVVFKDNLLAQARPDLAIKAQGGAIWRDREGLAWADPFRKEVWDYNIAIAEEAARIGFDEVQFDYVRFPDKTGLSFSMPNTEENRTRAISGFLEEAKKRLTKYNVFLAADIFGYVCWNMNDTDIGQNLEALAPSVDYISPMLYPSGFQYGIPGYRNPVANPREIVRLTLERARQRTGLPPERFRPWLQAFRDYAFDGRHFGGREITEQVEAAEDFGGWMLWNPRNVYAGDGLKRKVVAEKEVQAVGVKN